MRYEEAGVSLERAEANVTRLRALVESTRTPEVIGAFGHFAGTIRIPGAGSEAPYLVASIDGVGTKVLLARAAGAHAAVAGDVVRHGANDCLVLGARPLFFLDYVAWGRLDAAANAEVVRGLAEACREVGAAMLGGETAQMPDLYPEGEFDLAGCMVGIVSPGQWLDGSAIRPGDRLLGLPSTGLHTNGYSLARAVLLERAGLGLEDPLPECGTRLGEALLAPHRSYGRAVLPLVERGALHGLAHVTGGGIGGNLERILPAGCRARVEPGGWPEPAIFEALRRRGEIPEPEMRRTFNLGVGLVLAAPAESADGVLAELRAAGERPFEVGRVEAGARAVVWSD